VARPADALCAECHASAASSKDFGTIHLPEQGVCNSCHTGKPGLPGILRAESLPPGSAK
jgi:hypothetical protein